MPRNGVDQRVRVSVKMIAVNGVPRPHGVLATFRGMTIRGAALSYVREMDIEHMVPANYQSIDLEVTCDAGVVRKIRVRPVLTYSIEGLRGDGSDDEPEAAPSKACDSGHHCSCDASEDLMIRDAMADSDPWWENQ